MTARFRASAAVIDVTPPIGFPLGGYMLRTGVSTGTLDPILARLLLLTSGDDALLLISLDWVHIDGRWAGDVRRAVETETGIGVNRTIITATHTHSGPGVFRSFITEADGEPAYLAVVSERIVETAGTLMAAARDVTPLFGSTKVTGIGTHRNDPGLAVDDELSVLTLRGTDTAAVGRVIAYGCHPTLLGPDNLLFSADWVGRGLAALDRQRGGVSVFINGAAGDVSTRFTREGTGCTGAGEIRRAVFRGGGPGGNGCRCALRSRDRGNNGRRPGEVSGASRPGRGAEEPLENGRGDRRGSERGGKPRRDQATGVGQGRGARFSLLCRQGGIGRTVRGAYHDGDGNACANRVGAHDIFSRRGNERERGQSQGRGAGPACRLRLCERLFRLSERRGR